MPASDVLASVHGAVAGLHRAGVVKAATMREFVAMCLLPALPGPEAGPGPRRDQYEAGPESICV